MITRAKAGKSGLVLPSQSLPDNVPEEENEAGSHSALEGCGSRFTLLPTSYSFQDFSPFWAEAQQFAEQGIQPSSGTQSSAAGGCRVLGRNLNWPS